MLLSGVDFSGLFGLGDAISASQAADIVWDNMPSAVNRFTLPTFANMSVDEFKSSVAQALSGQYQLVQASSPPSNTVSDSVITNISPNNAGYIKSALDSMRSQGYYVVSVNAAPAAASSPTAVASPTGGGSSTWQPARAQYQAAIQAAQAVTSGGTPTGSAAPNIQRSNAPRRVIRPHVQTPAEKQRLLWIIGGFAAIFAVALGLIAARD